ncbi:MAG: dienelactone hydrolase family protein [Actinomycetota bacterium]|nr:dienelactone hydrolase family protein [Actinomycetota bacterium]
MSAVLEPELLWHDAHGRGEKLMVVVHGFGEHPVAALLLGSLLDPRRRYRICAPVSPLDVGPHKRTFYRSASRMSPDPESFAAAVDHVDRAIDAACVEVETDRRDVALVGFSQGGGLAAAVNYRRSPSIPAAAVVLFSARTYPPDLVDWDLAAAAGTRLFAGHGIRDRLSPSDDMQAFLEHMSAAGVDVTWVEHQYGHALDPDTVAAASRWLQV